MTNILGAIKRNYHPLFHFRKLALGRFLIKATDFPVWLSLPKVAFKVRGLSTTHRAAFAFPFQEPYAEALAQACVRSLEVRTFWDVGANIGYYTWLLKTVRSDLKVVMFEPFAKNIPLIRQTIAANAYALFLERYESSKVQKRIRELVCEVARTSEYEASPIDTGSRTGSRHIRNSCI